MSRRRNRLPPPALTWDEAPADSPDDPIPFTVLSTLQARRRRLHDAARALKHWPDANDQARLSRAEAKRDRRRARNLS